jgi:hypothetical protein
MKKQTVQSGKRKTGADIFDPFNDRLSRDIRNSLSEAFVAALVRMEPSAYRKAADRWWTAKPADIYLTYIQNRLLRYDRVNEQIRANHIDDAILQLLPIWNNELFFEAHDHLERIWSRAVGEKREALKGLIKAAGVYIHLEYKRKKAVASLAAKSLDIIRRHSEALTFITNLDVLKEKLKNLDPVPPRLENPALR